MDSESIDETRGSTASPAVRASRRDLLRLAGAAAVGGVASSLLASSDAHATTGAMQYGAANDAGGAETSLTASSQNTLNVMNTGLATAVRGQTTGLGTGVLGRLDTPSSNGNALRAIVNGAIGIGAALEGGQAHLFLKPGPCGPSISVTHLDGEVAYDSNTSAMWVCVATGAPGTWRKIGGSTTAGSLHPITPARVYDSRRPLPVQGVLATGDTRTISVADARNVSTGAVVASNVVPAGATAIAYNLTVVNTVGTNGFLAVNEGGNSTVTASAINWSAAGLTLANGSLVKLDGSRQITVICGGTSTSCNFIIDVVGYYL